jgi:hypothetical protein
MKQILTEWRRYLDEINAKKLKQMHPDQEEVIDKADRTLTKFSLSNKYLEYLVRKTIEWRIEGNDHMNRTFSEFVVEMTREIRRYDQLLQSGIIRSAMKAGKLQASPQQIQLPDSLNPMDITSFMKHRISVLLKVINLSEEWMSESNKKYLEKEGTEKIYEDDRYLVIHVKNKEASCKYGKGTKWCISGGVDNKFDEYAEFGNQFIFVINKKPEEDFGKGKRYSSAYAKQYYKFAFVLSDQDPSEIGNIYDAMDQQVTPEEVRDHFLPEYIMDKVLDYIHSLGQLDSDDFLTESLDPNKEIKVGKVIFDSEKGLGQVPWNQNVNYIGFVIWMKPIDFLRLNPERPANSESVKKLRDHILSQEEIRLGPPFIQASWDGEEDGSDGDWIVTGHEGRGRMIALLDIQPDVEVPVHVFPRDKRLGEMRARHVEKPMLFKIFRPDSRAENGRGFLPKRAILHGEEVTK